MAEYRRLITYVYNYEAGIKKHSVGFARVELIGEELRIKLEIKVPSLSGKPLKVYVYKMIRGGIQVALLKEVVVENGIVNNKIISPAKNIGDSDLGFHELSGFILYYTKDKCLVSDWKDQLLSISDIKCIETPITKKVVKENKAKIIDTKSDQINNISSDINGKTNNKVVFGKENVNKENVNKENVNIENISKENVRKENVSKETVRKENSNQATVYKDVKLIQPKVNHQREVNSTVNLEKINQIPEIANDKKLKKVKVIRESKVTKEPEDINKVNVIQAADINETDIFLKAQSLMNQLEDLKNKKLENGKINELIRNLKNKLTELEENDTKIQDTRRQEIKDIKIQETKIQDTNTIKNNTVAESLEIKSTVGSKGVFEKISGNDMMKNVVDKSHVKSKEGIVINTEEALLSKAEAEDKKGSFISRAEETFKKFAFGMMGEKSQEKKEDTKDERLNESGIVETMIGDNNTTNLHIKKDLGIVRESENENTADTSYDKIEPVVNELHTSLQSQSFEDEVNGESAEINVENVETNVENVETSGNSEENIETSGSSEEKVEASNNNEENELLKTQSINECKNSESFPWRDSPAARHIFHSFPRVYPFEDGEIAECVKIEPKDIGLLPMEMWGIGNNSFLIHGYCNYRHLLFAKKQTRSGSIYLLMVPGVYNAREKYMARMFGFEYFKCAKRRNLRDGEFGYWYITINFEKN